MSASDWRRSEQDHTLKAYPIGGEDENTFHAYMTYHQTHNPKKHTESLTNIRERRLRKGMEGRKAGTLALIAVFAIIGLGYVLVSNRGSELIVEVDPNEVINTEEMEEHSEPEAPAPEKPQSDQEELTHDEHQPLEADVIFKTDNLDAPNWVPSGVNHPPWEGSIYLATSDDGETFTDELFFVQHAGVPHLLLTQDNKIVATFQYFSYENEELFECIGYTVSEDYGENWSKLRAIRLEERYSKGSKPVDPTLVQLEDGRLRLYFTFHEPGTQYAAMYSSSSLTLDGLFKDEGMQLSVDNMLLDPAVVYFDGMWHHYTTDQSGSGTIHSISEDGSNFELQDNIESDYSFLGDAIVDDGKLRFYGTGRGVVLAESEDGYVFTKVKENVADGADAGIVKLPNGSYLILYTKVTTP